MGPLAVTAGGFLVIHGFNEYVRFHLYCNRMRFPLNMFCKYLRSYVTVDLRWPEYFLCGYCESVTDRNGAVYDKSRTFCLWNWGSYVILWELVIVLTYPSRVSFAYLPKYRRHMLVSESLWFLFRISINPWSVTTEVVFLLPSPLTLLRPRSDQSAFFDCDPIVPDDH